jgi:hypothetical protein
MIPVMQTSEKRPLSSRVAFLAAFAFIVLVGVLSAAYVLKGHQDGDAQGDDIRVDVPTEDEYRAELTLAVRPFLDQALRMSADDILSANETALALAGKTRERVIGILAPSREDVQLRLVLLLDRWIMAFEGDADEANAVLDTTAELIAAYPWLLADDVSATQ